MSRNATKPAPLLALLLAMLAPGVAASQDLLSTPGSPQDEARTLLSEAAAALEAGDLDGAEARFREASQLAPENAMAWLGLSSVQEKRGDLVGAVEMVREARKHAPGEAFLALAEGQLAARLGTTEPALEALAEARRLAPAEPGGYVLAALLLRDAGEREQAIALLEEAFAAKLPSPRISEELCFLLISLDRHERAADVARQALEAHPESAPLQLARGLALAAMPETRGSGRRVAQPCARRRGAESRPGAAGARDDPDRAGTRRRRRRPAAQRRRPAARRARGSLPAERGAARVRGRGGRTRGNRALSGPEPEP